MTNGFLTKQHHDSGRKVFNVFNDASTTKENIDFFPLKENQSSFFSNRTPYTPWCSLIGPTEYLRFEIICRVNEPGKKRITRFGSTISRYAIGFSFLSDCVVTTLKRSTFFFFQCDFLPDWLIKSIYIL